MTVRSLSTRAITRPTTMPTVAAAAAVLLTSTAFAGVLLGGRWVVPSVLVVAAVAAVGQTGRTLRWWPVATLLAQILGLLTVLTLLFTSTAIAGILPGPAALSELGGVLRAAAETVRTGVPPVPTERPLQCLIALGLGVVALLVDLVAVTVGAPAVAGLVLLAVFALPASVASTMLPWWTFACGAAGFALLLTVCSPAGGGHFGRITVRRQAGGVASVATVIALLIGAAFTGIGTEGSLPGSRTTGFGEPTDGIGIRPFTSLRGQLNRDEVIDLFRVRGLPQDTYLRAMTLRRFDPGRGWELDGLTQGVPAQGRLPLPEGTEQPTGMEVTAEIDPVGYRDPWLPVFGIPQQIDRMGPNWRYDPAAGIVFTQTTQESTPYTERFLQPMPDGARLRASDAETPKVDPAYLAKTGITPEIADLARRVTGGAQTDFDRAVALNKLFTEPVNGFKYELETAPATSTSALSDFLFRGKRGYCEQYASAMAVLLRAVDIPSRVAVGFTAGRREGNAQVITTDDAHAWVEAYFPGVGWTTFDPTPLSDGRTTLPDYLDRELNPLLPPSPPGQGNPVELSPNQQPGPAPGQWLPQDDVDTRPVDRTPKSGTNPLGPTLGIAALLLALGAVPAVVREVRRRGRLRTVTEDGPGAADAAWREILDECWDRGTAPNPADTARRVANAFIDRHGLDVEGAKALRALVVAAERDWYAPPGVTTGPAKASELLTTILTSLRAAAPLSWRDRLLPRSVLRPGRDGQA